MTDGTSQGLFIVVAIVIFGIFVVLAYILFEDTLSPSLASMFGDASEQAQKRLNGVFEASEEDIMKCVGNGYANKTVEDDDFTYQFNDTCTEVTISNFKRAMEPLDVVVIPESYLGIPITKTTNLINGYYTPGANTTFTYAQVKKVVLPNTISEIGYRSFNYGVLEDINIPRNLKKIGDQAFDKTYLGRVRLPEGLESVGHMAFRHSKLTTVNLPSTLKVIGTRAFSGENYIQEYHVPESVETIGEGAFNVEYHLRAAVKVYYNSAFTTADNTRATDSFEGLVSSNGKVFDMKTGSPVEVTITE